MPQPDATTDTPTTCQIRGWTVFGPGYHKGGLFSPERNRRIERNFVRLFPVVTPKAKLGHQREQMLAERLRQSYGFPALGRVTSCETSDDGMVTLGLDDVPTLIGGLISAGIIQGGSVEIVPSMPNPQDASETIEGPILTAIAYLGEEQPAVKGRKLAPPVATFADGSRVPPADLPPELLLAMADVMTAEPAGLEPEPFEIGGRSYAVHAICFSEMTPIEEPAMNPMTPEQLAAAFAAMTPEQQAAAIAMIQPAPAADPAAQPVAQMSDGAKPKWFAEYEDKMNGRLGAVEKFAEDAQKQTGKTEEQVAEAMSADFDAKIVRKVPKHQRDHLKAQAKKVLLTRCFGMIENDAKTAFAEFTRPWLKLPDDPMLRDQVQDSVASGKRELSPLQQVMLRKGGLLAQEAPLAVKSILESAA